MNESTNPEPSKKRGWSIVRKAQIMGALVCGIFTAGIVIYCRSNHPDFMDIGGLISFFTMLPAMAASKLFGISLLKDNNAGELTIFSSHVIVIINSILGFLIGDIVGRLIKLFKNNGENKL